MATELESLISGGKLDIDLGINDPSIGGGYAAGIGTRALSNDGYLWMKTEVADTGWNKVLFYGDFVNDVTGDMLSSLYDPTNASSDAFNMGNMAESGDFKIMTSDERTKLSGIESGAQVNTIDSITGGITGSYNVSNIVSLSSGSYNNTVPTNGTLYIVTTG